MTYRIAIERGEETLSELFPLYATHYREMQERLARDGITVADFDARWDQYCAYWIAGHLINYVVRTEDGKPVGYSNVYLTHDMHNGEFIAREDTIFILKEHRNGIGKKLVQFILADLKARGVKRVNVNAMTDLRVAKLWQRMGFKHAAHAMTYTF